jgi:hypothetical protein
MTGTGKLDAGASGMDTEEHGYERSGESGAKCASLKLKSVWVGGDGEDMEQWRQRHKLMQGPRVRPLKNTDTRVWVNWVRNARV